MFLDFFIPYSIEAEFWAYFLFPASSIWIQLQDDPQQSLFICFWQIVFVIVCLLSLMFKEC